jgi:hypothetical protein
MDFRVKSPTTAVVTHAMLVLFHVSGSDSVVHLNLSSTELKLPSSDLEIVAQLRSEKTDVTFIITIQGGGRGNPWSLKTWYLWRELRYQTAFNRWPGFTYTVRQEFSNYEVIVISRAIATSLSPPILN